MPAPYGNRNGGGRRRTPKQEARPDDYGAGGCVAPPTHAPERDSMAVGE
jgi:hypothetical protein